MQHPTQSASESMQQENIKFSKEGQQEQEIAHKRNIAPTLKEKEKFTDAPRLLKTCRFYVWGK